MTGQSAEAKRVADDGAWRVLYGAVCRDRHVDAAHRHVLCTPDVILATTERDPQWSASPGFDSRAGREQLLGPPSLPLPLPRPRARP